MSVPEPMLGRDSADGSAQVASAHLEPHEDPRTNKTTENQTLSSDRQLHLCSDFPKIVLGFTDIDSLVIQRGSWSTEGEHTEVLCERTPRQDACTPSPSLGTRSALTIDEELSPRQPVLLHHGLPILPGPSHLQWQRALGTARQGHAVPDLDLQVPQGLGEVWGSCRREQWEGARAGPRNSTHRGLCPHPEPLPSCQPQSPGHSQPTSSTVLAEASPASP